MSKRFLIVVVVAFGWLSNVALAAESVDLPADLVSLLPENPAALVAMSSLNELADEYVNITRAVGAESTREDVFAIFGELLPNAAVVLDLDKPLVVAVGLPNIMAGENPPFTYILPLRPGFKDYESLGGDGVMVRRTAGRYLALADWAGYSPAAEAPALLAGLTPAAVAATVDLAQIIQTFGPFVDMGLAMIPTEEDEDPALMAALADAVHAGLASLNRWDMSLDHDGGYLSLYNGLKVNPGSALDLGPQPDFDRALALSGALPADADFLQVVALDQSRVMQAFEEYYVLSMQNSLVGLDDEQATKVGAWFRDYMDQMVIWASPMAAALSIDGPQLAAHAVFEPADPAAATTLTQLLDEMNDLGIGYSLTRQKDRKIAGVKFRMWDVEVDEDQVAKMMPESTGPDVMGAERMQAGQMLAILEKVTAPVYLGTDHGRLFLATADDTADLARMVKNARHKGKPRPLVAAVAAKSGPACHQVLAGDLLSVMRWMTGVVDELEADDLAFLTGVSIPFEASVTVDEPGFGVKMGMDVSSLGQLVAMVQAMEEADDDGGHDDGGHDDDGDDEY